VARSEPGTLGAEAARTDEGRGRCAPRSGRQSPACLEECAVLWACPWRDVVARCNRSVAAGRRRLGDAQALYSVSLVCSLRRRGTAVASIASIARSVAARAFIGGSGRRARALAPACSACLWWRTFAHAQDLSLAILRTMLLPSVSQPTRVALSHAGAVEAFAALDALALGGGALSVSGCIRPRSTPLGVQEHAAQGKGHSAVRSLSP